jgi:flagellar hook-associated protein 3 FlgL
MTLAARLGSANTYDIAVRNIMTRQSNLSGLQENLTSGKKVVRASDDPTGAALAERAIMRLARIETDQRALASQRSAIVQAESTLGDVTDALQNFRDLVVSAGNASYTTKEHKGIADQLTGLRNQILTLANRKDTNGLPLFSALGSALQPFVGPQTPLAQDYTFRGLPGQTASTDVAIPFALDGERAFMMKPERDGAYNVTITNVAAPAHGIGTSGVQLVNSALASSTSAYTITITGVDTTTTLGTTSVSYQIDELDALTKTPIGSFAGTNSYPTGKAGNVAVTEIPGLALSITGAPGVGDVLTLDPRPSIFSVLDDAIRDIGNAPNGNAVSQAVGQALNNIDIGMSRISAIRGQAGDLLNRADRISANQDRRSIEVEGDRSRAEDLDITKGISDFQNQQTGYQAALQSYAQVQKLSLFNFL